MIAKGDYLPLTLTELDKLEAEENYRRLVRRQMPPIETLRLIPGTARWAYEHVRRGLPVPRIQPPIEKLLESSTKDAV